MNYNSLNLNLNLSGQQFSLCGEISAYFVGIIKAHGSSCYHCHHVIFVNAAPVRQTTDRSIHGHSPLSVPAVGTGGGCGVHSGLHIPLTRPSTAPPRADCSRPGRDVFINTAFCISKVKLRRPNIKWLTALAVLETGPTGVSVVYSSWRQ